MVADGAGGVFVGWRDYRNYSTRSTDIYAQHILSNGTIAPGWPSDGVPICVDPSEQDLPSLITDGTGGILVAWDDARYGASTSFAQHILGNGSIAPGWAVDGNQVSPVGRIMFGLATGGADGFYMANAILHPTIQGYSDIYVERLTFDGAPAPGWTLDGLKVCGAPSFRGPPSAVDDGSGGVFLSWYDYRYPYDAVFASHVLGDATLANGWTVDGTLVSQPNSPCGIYQGTGNGALVADGVGGVYVEYIQVDTTGNAGLIQHLLGNGQVAPGWQPYGDRVSTRGETGDASMGADGQGGVVVSWSEGTCCGRFGIWAQRFALDGPVPVELSLVSADVRDGTVMLDWYAAGATSFNPTIERRTATSYWALLGTPSLDGAGHIRYEDRAVTPGGRYGYRLSYTEEGAPHYSAETWIDVPSPRLALDGLRPNPAVGAMAVSFSLPDAQSASLEVVDVTGRRVAQREVGSLGVGTHLVRLTETSALKPGIYWLRLRQGDRALLTRGAIVR